MMAFSISDDQCRTMRIALLLLIVPQITSAFPPRKPDDVEGFNDAKSRLVTEIISQELSTRKCRLQVGGADLPELYYHPDTSGATVRIRNAHLVSPSCVFVTAVSTDIFAARLDLTLIFPKVIVKGDVTRETSRTRSFRLILRNVTGSGLCFTRWTDTGYEIVDCDLRYDIARQVFFDRMRAGVTNALTGNVVAGANSLLRDLKLQRHLRNRRVFEEYRNYVIESTVRANEFVDDIIAAVRKVIVERYHDGFAIPDIEERFRKKGLLVEWQGSFKADHGRIRGLSTVSREGDTSFATDNTSRTHFFGNLSFERLHLRYDRYRAEFMNFGPTGTLTTTLRPIRVRIHPIVDFRTGKIELEEFAIGHVGDVVVELTGLGTVLSWIVSMVATWVVGTIRDRIVSDLEKRYDEYIRSLLSGYTIDDLT